MSGQNIARIFDRLAFVYPSRQIVLGSQAKDDNSPDTTSVAYDLMWRDWELIDDLEEGRDKMILKERRWLPQEPGEEFDSYLVRLYRTFLFTAFSDTLNQLSAKPFVKTVKIVNEERVPDGVKDIYHDVDLMGNDLSVFAKEIFRAGMKYGHTLILVDFPKVDNPDELTLADELEQNIRPYWIHITPTSFIGWRWRKERGHKVVTQIRYRERRTVEAGKFGDGVEDVIKVWNAPVGGEQGNVQTWRRNSQNKWELIEERLHSYPGIPITWLPIHPTNKGLFESTPPLRGLAELNLEHWQKSSDHSNILRFISIAMLLLTGIDNESNSDEEESGGPDDVIWGVNQILHGPQGADGKYIEHSGKGEGSLKGALLEIQSKMEMAGMEPMMSRQSDVTATAQRKDDQKTTSSLQEWIVRVETTLEWISRITAIWRGEPTDFIDDQNEETRTSFDVFSQFGLKIAARDDAGQILAARKEREITRPSFIREWKKRGLLGDEIDEDTESAAVDKEKEDNFEKFGSEQSKEDDDDKIPAGGGEQE